MLKKWIVCAALAALVGVAPAAGQDGSESALSAADTGRAMAGGAVGGASVALVTTAVEMPATWMIVTSPLAVFSGIAVGSVAVALVAQRSQARRAAERAECDLLPRFQPRELREAGVENRVQCRRRHRGVEPGRFRYVADQPAGRRADGEFTPTRESCAAYWRLSPRFRVQCRGVALERLDAWAASGPDQPSAVLPAAAVERLRADALERQRFDEIAQERERRAGEQADR